MNTFCIIVVITVALNGLAWTLPASKKIDPVLRNSLRLFGLGLINVERVNIHIRLLNGTGAILASLSGQEFGSREERLNAVGRALQAHAALTQGPVIQVLNTFNPLGIKVTPFWVDNTIFVQGAPKILVDTVAALRQVSGIQEEFFMNLYSEKPSFESLVHSTRQNGVNTYGVKKVRAPDVWNLGFKGQGIVVGGIDTGVLGTHQSLRSNYVGTYGWYDPYGKTTTPTDDGGHGTHTMGTIVGTGGIGVAPSAKWMACKGCDTRSCSSSALTACGQFMACPSLPDGSSKDCSKAPHIVNNSWGGGKNSTWYNYIVNTWRTANIIPVFSSGNSGPYCSSANSPGDQPNLISVGATDSSDYLAGYSSVGPTLQGRIKPDIAAPGSSVQSALKSGDSSYGQMSGTSMAAPHVSGIVALLLSKDKTLSYAQIYSYLTTKADRSSLSRGSNCGGKTDTSDWPNNSFGYGRVNAYNSITAF